MNILMTGGTGLIGQAFIRQFNDNQFTVLTRSMTKARAILPESVKLIDSLVTLPNLDAFDAVINLAGEPIIGRRWCEQQKQVICQSRWHVTHQLVELFKLSHIPPEIFLSASAIGAYGNRGKETLTESSSVQISDFPAKVCIEWENIAKQADPYTRVILLRTGIVLDPRGGALAKMLLPFKWGLGGRIGQGQQYMSWIHYQDHISAMRYLLTEKRIDGVINLVAPECQTNCVFTQTLAQVLNRPAILPVPKVILQWAMGESACLLLDSQKVLPQKLLHSEFCFAFSNLKSALTNLLKHTLN